MTPGPPLLASGICLLAAMLCGRAAPRFWLAATVAGAAAALAAAVCVLAGGAEWDWHGAFRLGGERLHLRLDAVSALFVALLGVVGGLGTVYARGYWTEDAH